MPSRREFLSIATATVTPFAVGAAFGADDAARVRACVIGHTGRGDYGHGLDVALSNRPGIEVVAVADADEAGRAKGVARCKAKRGYADYREMIEKERPGLVIVGPRTTGERREMLLAAVGAGAHVYTEKPFVRVLADADDVLALAERKGVRIAVAHQMRLAPAVVHLKTRIDAGLIGDVAELRAIGKQDKRAGGEDLAVLGIHLFDLMRLYAGDAQWCQAVVQEKGKLATLADARPATEDIGPVLGDQIFTRFGFGGGVTGTFTSSAKLRDETGHWGLEIVGTKGAARVLADIWPRVMVRTFTRWEDAGRSDAWRPMEDDPATKTTVAERANGPANARVADDWLAAIAEKREPLCSGQRAARAIEMQMAVWRAGLSGGRVEVPLKERGHPLLP
jgi:predicted dehydrogenase